MEFEPQFQEINGKDLVKLKCVDGSKTMQYVLMKTKIVKDLLLKPGDLLQFKLVED